MEPANDLNRFLDAQENNFNEALSEIKNGKKQSHWMWFIFPQIAGLGFSHYSVHYGIQNTEEAALYLQHPILGKRLIEISMEILKINDKTAEEIFGKPDDLKLKSCMTLFSLLDETNPVFHQVLVKYFDGVQDAKTIKLLHKLQ
ncbi:DUF1810 domain-containing protein [Flavobacterium degerlachei]|jgi:uncharacterized protein (DUF1810 family)|uniref:Uncharacterized protein, DUF1810 family n=1 Tax=Flavobacterium degerlachei TaxID=229203 RepID=A0A1H3F7B0_9FLAO|nr:DUF1810 domain-containing protein [Flavobacterium degerlachei]SDX86820.1 Uncharacterized protein, DUF1810 family [Flavobacterium degerlachei]